jgi:cell division septum initiation protein DivIVA
MNVFQALDSMEEALNEAKPLPWPMQARSVVDKSKLKKLISRTRDSLPEEVHQARWISRETRRIAEETRGKADRVVREAQSRAQEILSKAEVETQLRIQNHEVVTLARQEAEKILEEARVAADRVLGEADAKAASVKASAEQVLGEANAKAAAIRAAAEKGARETREDADRYAMSVLGGMETELSKILSIVKQGKESLHDGN